MASASDGTEIEWQFDALDLRPVERWLASLPSRPQHPDLPVLTALAKPLRRLVDNYVDTEDWRVGQAGFVLRTRRRGRVLEATMKDTRPANAAGLRERLEVTEALPAAGLGSLGSEGPVGRRITAIAGRRPLVGVLEVRTRRQPFSLRAAGTEVAEVALDDTTIVVGAGQRPVQLRRVEVEVHPDWVDALAPVIEELQTATGLRPATLSKFEAGLLAAGVEIPGPPDLGPTQVGPTSTLGDLAFAVVRRQVRLLIAHEPGTRLGEDIEELHDMRVATRRLRAAIELFADALPARAQTIRAELKWLADVLGAVRDLDVQLERMTEMAEWASGWAGTDHDAPLGHLASVLEDERTDARRHLLDALDSPRWERLATALVAMARQGPNRRMPVARQPAAAAVPDLVAARHRAVNSAAKRAKRSGVATDYHRLRIRCKRLRYSLEFTAGLYGNASQKFVRKLTHLQDQLGMMQDAEVAAERLRSLATPASTPTAGAAAVTLPASTVFVMGGLAEHYRRESDELRHAMSHHLAFLHTKTWSTYESVMERARGQALLGVAARPSRPAPASAGGPFDPAYSANGSLADGGWPQSVADVEISVVTVDAGALEDESDGDAFEAFVAFDDGDEPSPDAEGWFVEGVEVTGSGVLDDRVVQATSLGDAAGASALEDLAGTPLTLEGDAGPGSV